MAGPEVFLGFVFLVLFIVILVFMFSLLGIEPPCKVGQLPWMVE